MTELDHYLKAEEAFESLGQEQNVEKQQLINE
jgi:hypothetical protein